MSLASALGSLARVLLVVTAASKVASVSAANTGHEIRLATRATGQDAGSLIVEARHVEAVGASSAADASAVSWSADPQAARPAVAWFATGAETGDPASISGGLDKPVSLPVAPHPQAARPAVAWFATGAETGDSASISGSLDAASIIGGLDEPVGLPVAPHPQAARPAVAWFATGAETGDSAGISGSLDSASTSGGLDKPVGPPVAPQLDATDGSTSGSLKTTAVDIPNFRDGQPAWLSDESGQSSQRIPGMWKDALKEAKVSSERVGTAIAAHGKAVEDVFQPAARMVGQTKDLHKAELKAWLADEKTRLAPFDEIQINDTLELEVRDEEVDLQEQTDVVDEDPKVRVEAERTANDNLGLGPLTNAEVKPEQATVEASS